MLYKALSIARPEYSRSNNVEAIVANGGDRPMATVGRSAAQPDIQLKLMEFSFSISIISVP